MWIDIDGTIGLNAVMNAIGPILILAQPVYLFIIFKGHDLFASNQIILTLNALFCLYFVYWYICYLFTRKRDVSIVSCPEQKKRDCHLSWAFGTTAVDEDKNEHGYIFYAYIILTCINVGYLFHDC